VRMRDHHELFGLRITRALFAVGGLAFFTRPSKEVPR
jgi:hypothetical protein